jgi:hypothetical protein
MLPGIIYLIEPAVGDYYIIYLSSNENQGGAFSFAWKY